MIINFQLQKDAAALTLKCFTFSQSIDCGKKFAHSLSCKAQVLQSSATSLVNRVRTAAQVLPEKTKSGIIYPKRETEGRKLPDGEVG